MAYKRVSTSSGHTLAIREQNYVWACGLNYIYQLGDGTNVDKDYVVQVLGPSGIGFLDNTVSVAAGNFHSVALKSDGTLWSWGFNGTGQLGINSSIDAEHPTQVWGPEGVEFLTDIVSLGAGDSFTVAVKSNGSVWAWGTNSSGSLGDGTYLERFRPVQVKGVGGTGYLTDVTHIECGNSHVIALKSDGTLVTWGFGTAGQLGNGNVVSSFYPMVVANISNAVAISASQYNSGAVLSDGSVWTCGSNSQGQLGNNTVTPSAYMVQVLGVGGTGFLEGAVDISVGRHYTLAILEDSSVVAWGWEYYGILGNGSNEFAENPAHRVPALVHGINGTGTLTNVAKLSMGSYHVLALMKDGSVTGWGTAAYYQMCAYTPVSLVPIPTYFLAMANATAARRIRILDFIRRNS